MNFRILLADDEPRKVARQGFTDLVERELRDVSLAALTIPEAEAMLRDRDRLPPGYQVVLVQAI